jgi:hypothetical protein
MHTMNCETRLLGSDLLGVFCLVCSALNTLFPSMWLSLYFSCGHLFFPTSFSFIRALFERAQAAAKELSALSSGAGNTSSSSGVPPEDAKRLADQVAQCKAAHDECFLKSTQPKKKTKPRLLHADDEEQEDDDEEVEGVIESTANGFQGLGADSRHEF